MRTLLLLFFLTLLAPLHSEIFTGRCGASLTYTLDTSTGVLSIEGSGYMNNYDNKSARAPWSKYNLEIQTVTLPSGLNSIGSYAFESCWNLTSITIPNSVTAIGKGAFWVCSALTDLTLPSGLKSIEDRVFDGCYKLAYIALPSGLESIGRSAFSNCWNLTSITIPNSVTTIGYGAFGGCKALTSLTLPSSLTSIGYDILWGCDALRSIITEQTTPTTISKRTFDRVDKQKTKLFVPKGSLRAYVQAEYWKDFENIVEYDKSDNITGSCGPSLAYTLNPTTGVLSIVGSGDMYNYTSLSSSSPAPWGKYTLNIQTITLPSGVTSIGSHAFMSCHALTSVALPSGLKSIGEFAFAYCSLLSNLTLPSSVKSIGEFSFVFCSGLTSVNFSSGLKSIGKHAFDGCKALKIIHLPSGLESIGEGAFWDCTSLQTLFLPSSITSIGNAAFWDCTSLRFVDVYAQKPPIAGPTVFMNVSLKYLYVPAGCKSRYAATDPWRNFEEIKELTL